MESAVVKHLHAWSFFVGLTLIGCSASSQRSEVHLVIDADEAVRAQTASLRVVLAGRPRDTDIWQEAPPRIFDQGTPIWPRELTFPPKDGDSSREFSVKATALDADEQPLIVGRILGRFTRGTSEVRLMLTADCLSSLVHCNAEQTCERGQCVDAHLAPDAGVPDAGAADTGAVDSGPVPDGCIPRAVYRDEDEDGFGVASSRLMTCVPMDGYVEADGDCNDTSGAMRPGVTELCDGADNNCNMQTDEGCGCTTGTTRACGSGLGECRPGTETCTAGAWVGCTATTAVSETCDGRDNDCNGVSDNGATCSARPNTLGGCARGACTYTCNTTYGDCDSTPENGCESAFRTDARNCGRCGNSCGSGTCYEGTCRAATVAPWCVGSFCEISTTGAPSARANHSAVWTGSEMIIWGGSNGEAFLNTGARYNPTTNSWTALDTSPATPSARSGHTAVWSDSEMIVWGGADTTTTLNSGGRYNPSTSTWTALPARSARVEHVAVWDDVRSEMIVWSGRDGHGRVNSGDRYSPSTNTWTSLALTATTPIGRADHSAVWDITHSEMIIWGGHTASYVATGERYNPATNAWSPLPALGAPSARYAHSAIWSNSEMIIWGGVAFDTLDDGARYNPTTSSWSALPTTASPPARGGHTAIWTGFEMIVWGGMNSVWDDVISTGWLWRL